MYIGTEYYFFLYYAVKHENVWLKHNILTNIDFIIIIILFFPNEFVKT